jgi:Rod binding domain-containing protein
MMQLYNTLPRPTVYLDHSGNEVDRKKQDELKLKAACQDFESLLIEQMFKIARQNEDDGFIKKSKGEKIFTEMLDEEYSKLIASGSVNGLADMLYNNLTEGAFGQTYLQTAED